MDTEIKQGEYLVTARKWRPLNFKDVAGQEHITITLQNAIKSGRIHHAYLFSGPRGVGKTTTARIYARAINCFSPIESEPCNECESCRSILDNRSMDVIEIDGASNNSVDDIRKLRENSRYPPISGKYKMYIIDEVHMLSTSAFNALLKTLEEPPPHLLFVFATTESHKVLPTILSRCQRFDFRRMELDTISQQIKFIADKENIKVDEESLIAIAKKADGSMRDSQSIFDQVVAFCGTDIKYKDLANALHLVDQDFFFRISSAIKNKDLRDIFGLSSEVISRGYDLQECLSGLMEHFRNILTIIATADVNLIESSPAILNRYRTEAIKFTKGDILRFLQLTATTEQELRFAPQPRIRFELALTQMASMDSSIEITKLITELKALKKKVLNQTSAENNSAEQQSSTSSIVDKIKNDLVINGKNSNPKKEESGFNYNKFSDITVSDSHSISSDSPAQDILESGWEEFKKKFAVSKYGFYMLSQKEMIIPKFFNGEIVLQCKNDFFAENLKIKLLDLKNHIQNFYNGPVNIKVVIADENLSAGNIDESKQGNSLSTVENKEINSITSNDTSVNNVKTGELSPIEHALVDMFGAKQIKIIRDTE